MSDSLAQIIHDRLIAPLIAREGGFVDNPADRGGPTKWGITELTARRYGYTGPMRGMSVSAAADIYWRGFVREPGIDLLAKRSPPIAAEALDTGVNMGKGEGVRFLQTALNAFNLLSLGAPELWPTLKTDGDYGGRTDGALAACLAHPKRGRADVLIAAMNCQQGGRYLGIVGGDPSQRVFAWGWMLNRVLTPA